MIRIYLDWNVMVQMKKGNLDDLQKILSRKDRFFIPYSTSHIGDILSSYKQNDDIQKKMIESDLDFISTLTNNLCLSNSGKQINLNTSDPLSLYQQRIEDDEILSDFSLSKIEELFNVEGFPMDIVNPLVSILKLISIGDSFKTAIENPESGKYISQLFPDLTENPTMDGFFRSFSKLYQNLNEKEDYKLLREITRDGLGLNRDKIFDNDKPYELIEAVHDKHGFKWNEYIDNTKNAPEWFNAVLNEYLKLDMHGYQEDSVTVKPKKRKETFKNTIEDGFHAAFASTCHFYITNDKKSYKKTKQVYDRLKINTLVLKPDEFIDYYSKSLDMNFKSVGEHLKIAVDVLKTNNYIETKVDNGVLRTYLFPYFIFDFFNKIVVLHENNEEKPTIMLGRNSPTNSNVTYVFELKNLVEKLNNLFRVDEQEFGIINEDELKQEMWSGISWKFDDVEFRLLGLNGHIQLYLNYD